MHHAQHPLPDLARVAGGDIRALQRSLMTCIDKLVPFAGPHHTGVICRATGHVAGKLAFMLLLHMADSLMQASMSQSLGR